MPAIAEQTIRKRTTEVRNIIIELMETLDTATISGTPTLLSEVPTGLTITNIAASASQRTVRGKTVPTGKALTFTAAGGVSGTNGTMYTLIFQLATSDAQVIEVENVRIFVKD